MCSHIGGPWWPQARSTRSTRCTGCCQHCDTKGHHMRILRWWVSFIPNDDGVCDFAMQSINCASISWLCVVQFPVCWLHDCGMHANFLICWKNSVRIMLLLASRLFPLYNDDHLADYCMDWWRSQNNQDAWTVDCIFSAGVSSVLYFGNLVLQASDYWKRSSRCSISDQPAALFTVWCRPWMKCCHNPKPPHPNW